MIIDKEKLTNRNKYL